MAKDPLRTKLCDMLGLEFPIIAFTHCKDVAVAVINAGGFAVLGEAMHTPDEIAADIKWIRDRIDGKAYGIDLVLPASVPPAGDLDELTAHPPLSLAKCLSTSKRRSSSRRTRWTRYSIRTCLRSTNWCARRRFLRS